MECFGGAILLFALNQLMFGMNDDANSFISKAADGLMFNPFSNALCVRRASFFFQTGNDFLHVLSMMP